MAESQYLKYSVESEKVDIISTKPSIVGFLRKYLLCMTPVFALAVYYYIAPVFLQLANSVFAPITNFAVLALSAMNVPQNVIDSTASLVGFLLVMIIFLSVSWTFRSTEASGAIALSLAIPLIFAVVELESSGMTNTDILSIVAKILVAYNNAFPTGVFLEVIIMLIRTEMYRKSIRYEIADTGVSISGGLWRKQKHTIPYNQIGRVVLEQSIFGRLLNYGTVVPVGVAEWGSEYYMRGVGAGVKGDKVITLACAQIAQANK